MVESHSVCLSVRHNGVIHFIYNKIINILQQKPANNHLKLKSNEWKEKRRTVGYKH